MKSFFMFCCFCTILVLTGCFSHPIENVRQVQGYYTASNAQAIVIVAPNYFMYASRRASDYSKRHNLNLYSHKDDYHIIRNRHGYFLILGEPETCYSPVYRILSPNELKTGTSYLFGLIDQTVVLKKIPKKKAITILQSWGYDISKIEKAEYSNKFSFRRENRGELLYDTFSLRNPSHSTP